MGPVPGEDDHDDIAAWRALLLAQNAVLRAIEADHPPREMWDSLKSDGFTGWSGEMATGLRGNKDAKPSGFFTDRRSEQIEKDLGGFEDRGHSEMCPVSV